MSGLFHGCASGVEIGKDSSVVSHDKCSTFFLVDHDGAGHHQTGSDIEVEGSGGGFGVADFDDGDRFFAGESSFGEGF